MTNQRKAPVQKYACTLVSLLPISLNETKPHILPGIFQVPAAEKDDFNVLHIEEGISWIPNPLIEEGKPGSTYKQITTPNEMARSVVEDWVNAQICLAEGACPGLFWVEGRYEKDEIKEYFGDLLAEYKAKQIEWFRNLIALANVDWHKSKNLLSVSDLQRRAARWMGVRAEWVEVKMEETTSCPFCTVAIPPSAVKCPNCHEIVNLNAYKALKGEPIAENKQQVEIDLSFLPKSDDKKILEQTKE